ncbi:unnamed protein product [Durusdinium trenchii]|uniref:Uncharacterized protein n=2 Tax=Durusdinium trenchii TaxID=1381693 RepID=A0ABP0QLJ4_9DINO|eukprot:g22716.t1
MISDTDASWSSRDLANLLWAAGKLKRSDPLPSTTLAASELTAGDLANVVWTHAVLRRPLEPLMVKRLGLLGEFRLRELTNRAWKTGVLQLPEAILAESMRRVLDVPARIEARDLASLV